DAAWRLDGSPEDGEEANDHSNQAKCQQDRRGEQVVSIEATNYEQTIHMTGIFSLPTLEIDPTDLEATKKSLSGPSLFGRQGGSTVGVVGSVFVNARWKTAQAIVKDGASLY